MGRVVNPTDINVMRANEEAHARERLQSIKPADIEAALPDCPCTEDEIRQDEHFKESKSMVETFHPGAASGWRSEKPVVHELANGETIYPGQQCTFDKGGDLITHGEGAGSVDGVSPEHSTWQHFVYDVDPAIRLSPEEYREQRPANNGNGCKTNPSIPEEAKPESKLDSILKESDARENELDSILSEASAIENIGESNSSTGSLPEIESQSELSSSGM